MDETKKRIYLDQIDRDSSTVGVEIPEEIEIQGKEIPLKSIVFDVCSDGGVPSQYNMDVDGVKVGLRREKNEMVNMIESGEADESQAEDIVKKAKQIDRALNAITNPLDEDLESRIKRKEAQDKKKWRSFLDKIKGDDSKKGRR